MSQGTGNLAQAQPQSSFGVSSPGVKRAVVVEASALSPPSGEDLRIIEGVLGLEVTRFPEKAGLWGCTGAQASRCPFSAPSVFPDAPCPISLLTCAAQAEGSYCRGPTFPSALLQSSAQRRVCTMVSFILYYTGT